MEGGTVAQRKTTDDGGTGDVQPGTPDAVSGADPDGDGVPPAVPDEGGDAGDGNPPPPDGDGDPGDGGAGDDPAADAPLAAAPLEPPARRQRQQAAEPKTSAPASSPRDAPGGRHVAIIDHDGNRLDPDDLFDDPGAHTTFLVARTRIYQQFLHEGTVAEKGTQLLFAHGARVPRDQAEGLKDFLRRRAAAAADPG
jgi:hypothetical protein